MDSDYSEGGCSLTLGSTFPQGCLNTERAAADAQLETALTPGKRGGKG